jgi:hypothetical protein
MFIHDIKSRMFQIYAIQQQQQQQQEEEKCKCCKEIT